jgi:TRAP-type C4-dicarboxylate transport system substrate-binding protein
LLFSLRGEKRTLKLSSSTLRLTPSIQPKQRASFKAWEYVKNYYVTSAFHPKNVVVVNERSWQRLPDNQKKAVADAAAAAEKRGWQLSAERKSGRTLANGMTVAPPDAAMHGVRGVGKTMLVSG